MPRPEDGGGWPDLAFIMTKLAAAVTWRLEKRLR
jgi:hypothetical protein